MTKLTETQTFVLSRAAQRDDRNVLPLPGSLRGGAATKVVGALLSRGLVTETATTSRTKADAALNRFWRNDEVGHAILLHITDAGLAAIGVETAKGAASAAEEAPSDPIPAQDAAAPGSADTSAASATPRLPREGTKLAALVGLLRQPDGATMAEMTEATGWQPHTVRGALAASVKKKLGLEVTSDKPQGQDRIWRIA